MKVNNKDFYRITSFIKQNYGVDLNQKRTVVEESLDKILLNCNFTDLDQLLNVLEKKNDEIINSKVIGLLLTNYTYFLREPSHFEILSEVILPKIYNNGNKKKGIRVWSAATSSGQEAYSILMAVLNFLKEEIRDWNVEIIATDVSQAMIKKAKAGIYQKEEVEKIPDDWLQHYFNVCIDGSYKIKDSLKEYVKFKLLNLLSDFEFEKLFQVIFLRNVLIYFDSELIEQIVDKVADFLEIGGYLFIGFTETIEIKSSKLICIQPSVYRKI
ncbi:MAG: protein-glutamate O-methyltransferase CheR [Candidatus Galacturonibacter soehngenii]|nr:protein-glutamate O-methyltransferase CheR [Candidatus Galacturonibacter soehngenii]